MRDGQQRPAPPWARLFAALSAAAGLLPSCTYSNVADDQTRCVRSRASVSAKQPESRSADRDGAASSLQPPVPSTAVPSAEPESEANQLTRLRKRVKRLERNYELQQDMDRRIDAEVPKIDAGD